MRIILVYRAVGQPLGTWEIHEYQLPRAVLVFLRFLHMVGLVWDSLNDLR